MRPPLLNRLFASVSTLPGIGPRLEKLYARLLGREDEKPRIVDLLFHLPTGFVDRRNQPKLSEVVPDTVVTVAVRVEGHRPPPPNRPRVPYNIDTVDDTNTLTITYFNARRDYLEKLFPEGEVRYVSGVATLYDGHLQMVHPDRVVDEAGLAKSAADRSGLSAHRRIASQPTAQGDRTCARTRAEKSARMAGCGLAQAQRFLELRRCAAPRSSPGDACTISSPKARPGRG